MPRCYLKFGQLLVQTPLSAQTGFGVQPRYKAPGDLHLKTQIDAESWPQASQKADKKNKKQK